ncbi:MAG: hypothetical protein BA863_06660 [Desulfovibrio sp. S3730MH75]|nr:MAG: hypothetical protein BA863_06660 [Desulfovibrio sp. S3730MH75]
MKKIILLTTLILACAVLAYAVNPDDYIEQDFMVHDAKPVQVRKQTSSTSNFGLNHKTYTDPVTGMEFLWVPAGCYQMGSNDGGSDEKPIHEVCVDDFWMGKCGRISHSGRMAKVDEK